MKANKYLVDFDTVVSFDDQHIKLMNDSILIHEETGHEANELRKKLVIIHELEELNFNYQSLEFDGKLDEWYQLVLVEPSQMFEGVTLVYHPDRDVFEIAENGFQFTEMAKVELMIKAFKV